MAIKYGFFNSVSGDRKYSAEDIGRYLQGIICSGVYADNESSLQVLAGGGLTVTVQPGRAMLHYHYMESDEALEFTLARGAELPRYDAIVMRLDVENRLCEIAVKQGTPSANPVRPAVLRNDTTKEWMLGAVYVERLTASITQNNVTDTRPDNSVCGWVTGVIDQVPTGSLLTQYQAAMAAEYAQLRDYTEETLAKVENFYNALTHELAIQTVIQEHRNMVTLASDTNKVYIGIPEYDPDEDVLFVNYRGLLYMQEDYTVYGSGSTAYVVLKEARKAGDPIEFTVLKSVLGGADEYVPVSTPDWQQNDENAADYVKNRTHWIEGVQKEIPLAYKFTDTDSDGVPNICQLTALPYFELGKAYIVNWNGVDYEVTGQDTGALTNNELPGVLLGNADVYSLNASTSAANTGEPFAIVGYTEYIASYRGMYGDIDTADGALDFTVSVREKDETPEYHQIDPKYIPDMPYTERTGTTLPEVTAEFPQGSLTGGGEVTLASTLGLVHGDTYIVTWDGVEYVCKCKRNVGDVNGMSMDALTLGNTAVFGGSDTGEPFIIGDITSPMTVSMAISLTDYSTHTFKVERAVIHKQEEKYLPDNVPRFYNFHILWTDFGSTASVARDGTVSYAEIRRNAMNPNTIVRANVICDLDSGLPIMFAYCTGVFQNRVSFTTQAIINLDEGLAVSAQFEVMEDDDTVLVITKQL